MKKKPNKKSQINHHKELQIYVQAQNKELLQLSIKLSDHNYTQN